MCKVRLKSGYRRTVNSILWEIIVDVDHTKNRAVEQCPMGFDLHPMPIQFLGMVMPTVLTETLCVERQETLKGGVTFANHSFV